MKTGLCSKLKYLFLRLGISERKIFIPSNGGTGIRLKIARDKFTYITMKAPFSSISGEIDKKRDWFPCRIMWVAAYETAKSTKFAAIPAADTQKSAYFVLKL